MQSLIRYTNRSRLGYFRDSFQVGNVILTEESIKEDAKRIREAPFSSNTSEIESVKNGISEHDFYIMYLTMLSTANKLMNDGDKKNSKGTTPTLTPVQITYLAKLMEKPLDFTIPVNSKSNRITEIATELGRTSQSFYNAIFKLKQSGWVYITEDSNMELQARLSNLRKIVKTQLKLNNGVALWDTLFRYTITNDRSDN